MNLLSGAMNIIKTLHENTLRRVMNFMIVLNINGYEDMTVGIAIDIGPK